MSHKTIRMSQKDNIFSIRLVKKNGKLDFKLSAEAKLYQAFVKDLEDGQEAEVFFEAYKDDGTNPQLAKIHASIRKLAQEMGYSFEEMKTEVKRRAGLCWENKNGDEECKSFANCSKEELALTIEALNHIGELVNLSFSR